MANRAATDPEATDQNGPERRVLSRTAFYALIGMTIASVLLATAAVVAAQRESAKVADLRKLVEEGTLEEAAVSAGSDPDNRHLTLVSADGSVVDAVVVAGNTREGFILGGNLKQLKGSAYQLWAEVDRGAVSIGMLGAELRPAAFTLPDGATALLVTEEKSAGATTPSQPVVRGPVRAA